MEQYSSANQLLTGAKPNKLQGEGGLRESGFPIAARKGTFCGTETFPIPVKFPMPLPTAPLALLCAVPREAEPLRSHLGEAQRVAIGRKNAWRGTIKRVPVVLFPTGMGKTNAAQATGALLERYDVRGVIGFGVAGAYPGSDLRVGDLALATHESYGDEGVDTPDGWISTEGIGIPLLDPVLLAEAENGESEMRFNGFPADPTRVSAGIAALSTAGEAVTSGPFVTVSCCSGTVDRGAELARRFGAVCESMEGAAVAHICELYGIPWLEVRGISNAVEDRDLTRWRLNDAIEAAARAVRILVREWK